MAIDRLAVSVAVKVSVPPGAIDAALATVRLKVKESAAGIWVAVEPAGSVAVARTGVLEAIGATGVFVGGTGVFVAVLVGGAGVLVAVFVGGTGVLVGGIGVFVAVLVGGAGVFVGGAGVLVGGTGVAVGATGVFVAAAVVVGAATVNVPALSCQAYSGLQPAPKTPTLNVYVPAGWLAGTAHAALIVCGVLAAKAIGLWDVW